MPRKTEAFSMTLAEARNLASYNISPPEAFYIDETGEVQWKPGRGTTTITRSETIRDISLCPHCGRDRGDREPHAPSCIMSQAGQTTDLVDRLRADRSGHAMNVACDLDDLCREAADEIERLRAELEGERHNRFYDQRDAFFEGTTSRLK